MKFEDFNILEFGNTVQITGFVLSGHGHNHIVHFPDEQKGDRAEMYTALSMDIGQFERFLYQSDVLNVEMGTEKKAIVRKSQRMIDTSVSWAVFRRDGYRCRYCGRDDVPLTVDHIDLYEHCGASMAENLVACCKADNRLRGNRTYEEWHASDDYRRVSVNLNYHVREDNAAILVRMDGLRALRVTKQRSR